MNGTTAVTTRQHFCKPDSAALLSVNPGVPIEDALELAANLMLYVERLTAADAFIDKSHEAAVVQHLSELAKALVKACQNGASEAGHAAL
ncbi:MAG: DUF3077 domain-containing protein [Pseudomonas sp.]|uniref:DUF3077 domain-containing protein n=1 Tax=Pseudomonas sp. TaxID=306 RepID=UPI0030F2FC76